MAMAAIKEFKRDFEDTEAKRSRVPLMLGLVGPSGGGKTYSALRLATGIQRVTGGDIFVIDTESRRALHYADRFKFRHVDFRAPFGPLDYLAAFEHCVRKGAKIVICDSMSHEHEGPGGVLEMHATERTRLATLWKTKESAAEMAAWGLPKGQRRRMINSLLQLPISTISCFRAKNKLRVIRGKDPEHRGFMAIAGEELVFEMTMNCLLLPKADGVPTWHSDEEGEQLTMKLPEQFRELFAQRAPLSEDLGESMAQWAEGGAVTVYARLLEEIETVAVDQLDALVPKIKAAQEERKINGTENAALRGAYKKRKEGGPSRAERDAEIARQNAPLQEARAAKAEAERVLAIADATAAEKDRAEKLAAFNKFRAERGEAPLDQLPPTEVLVQEEPGANDQ